MRSASLARTRYVLVVALAAALLLAAACSGDDNDDDGRASVTATGESTE